MSPETEWEQKPAFSSGATEATHPETIQALLGPSCVRVEPHDVDRDDDGIDFRAYLRRGSVLGIDMKARESGCSRFWRPCPQTGVGLEPEFALETWSVVPDKANGVHGRTGWTLDESKATDYTLHVFDVTDTPECFLLPFQLTRMAFRRRVREWTSVYRVEQQRTRRGVARMPRRGSL